MEFKEEKEVKIQDDGSIKITITTDDDLVLPFKGKKETIGIYSQVTIQHISKDKVSFYKEFALKQKKSTEEMIERAEDELENLKDVNIDLIPEKEMNVLKEGLPNALKAMFSPDNKDKEIKRHAKAIRLNVVKLASLDKAIKEITVKKTMTAALKENKKILELINKELIQLP